MQLTFPGPPQCSDSEHSDCNECPHTARFLERCCTAISSYTNVLVLTTVAATTPSTVAGLVRYDM
jgi:hypothetical protein